jgi:hypothetical protein
LVTSDDAGAISHAAIVKIDVRQSRDEHFAATSVYSWTARCEAGAVDFRIPDDLVDYLAELDAFIEAEIKPLEKVNDNIRFFDHRREDARTDWDRGGFPNAE